MVFLLLFVLYLPSFSVDTLVAKIKVVEVVKIYNFILVILSFDKI